jgi:SAM-dependent methyltransferase
MNFTTEIEKDIIQWDVKNWSEALYYWEKNVDWKKIDTCLELGSREGGLSLWLILRGGSNIICSDFKSSKVNAEKLHKKYHFDLEIKYQDIDAANIPFENYFDLIVFKSIIGGIGNGDIEKQQKVFDQIHKALKRGGKLLFAENIKASFLHRFFRNYFTKWSAYWRYVTPMELKKFLSNYSSFELKTNGVTGTFGRNEKQKNFLSKADKILLNHITPERWKYIAYGIATK